MLDVRRQRALDCGNDVFRRSLEWSVDVNNDVLEVMNEVICGMIDEIERYQGQFVWFTGTRVTWEELEEGTLQQQRPSLEQWFQRLELGMEE